MFCPYCGTESKIAEAKFCAKCGKMLPKMGNQGYQQPESPVKEQPERLAFDGVYDTNLPSGMYYGPMGHLNWLYKDVVTDKYDSAPIGTEYIIRFEFNEKEIVRYRRKYLNFKPKEEKKAGKAIISIKHGIDKFSLFTMPEQFEYVLAEIEKRCPNAVRGEVFKKK